MINRQKEESRKILSPDVNWDQAERHGKKLLILKEQKPIKKLDPVY